MPIRRDIPGIGTVEWPDGTPDSQIQQEIAENTGGGGGAEGGGNSTPPAMSAFKNFMANLTRTLGVSEIPNIPSGLQALKESGAGLRDVPGAAADIFGQMVGSAVGGSAEQMVKADRIMQGREPGAGGKEPYAGIPSPLQALGVGPLARRAVASFGGVPGVAAAMPPEAIARGMASLLPIVGPQAVSAGEQIGQGDISGGLGTAVGLTAPFALPTRVKPTEASVPAKLGINLAKPSPQGLALQKAISEIRASRRVKPTPSAVPSAAPSAPSAVASGAAPGAAAEPWPLPYQFPGTAEVASKTPPVVQKVPFTLGQSVGSPLLQKVEGALSNVWGAGTGPFTRRQKLLNETLSGYADALVKDISDAPLSHDAIQSQIAQSLAEAKQATRHASSAAYSFIDNLAEQTGLKPNVAPLRAEAQRLLAEKASFTKEGMAPQSWNAQLVKDLQQIAKGPSEVSFRALHDFRSNMRELVRGEGNRLPGPTAGIEQKLAGMADAAIREASQKASPEIAARLREADAFSRQRHFDFDNVLARKVAENVEPAKLPSIVLGAPAPFVASLRRNLPLKDWRMLKARTLRDFLDDSMRDEGQLAAAGEMKDQLGLQSVAGDASIPLFKPGQLVSRFRKTPGETWKALLNERELQGLQTFVGAVERSHQTTRNIVGHLINMGMLYQAGSAITHADIGSALGAAGMYGALNIIARVLAKPGGGQVISRAIEGATRFPGQPSKWGLYGAARLGQMMQTAAREERAESLGSMPTPEPSPSEEPGSPPPPL